MPGPHRRLATEFLDAVEAYGDDLAALQAITRAVTWGRVSPEEERQLEMAMTAASGAYRALYAKADEIDNKDKLVEIINRRGLTAWTMRTMTAMWRDKVRLVVDNDRQPPAVAS